MSIKEQIHPKEKQWFAVKCKYKCEKRLQDELGSRGVNVYVPLQKKVRMTKSGRRESQNPLIPAHIFVHIDQSEYLKVLRHPHVFQFLNFSGKIVAIPEKEMNMMKRVVGEYEDIECTSIGYHTGDRVEIVHGDLTGLKGTLIEKENYNFRVVLETLGMGLEISVDPKHLLKVGSALLVA